MGSEMCIRDRSDDDLGEYFDESTADDDFDPEKWRNVSLEDVREDNAI